MMFDNKLKFLFLFGIMLVSLLGFGFTENISLQYTWDADVLARYNADAPFKFNSDNSPFILNLNNMAKKEFCVDNVHCGGVILMTALKEDNMLDSDDLIITFTYLTEYTGNLADISKNTISRQKYYLDLDKTISNDGQGDSFPVDIVWESDIEFSKIGTLSIIINEYNPEPIQPTEVTPAVTTGTQAPATTTKTCEEQGFNKIWGGNFLYSCNSQEDNVLYFCQKTTGKLNKNILPIKINDLIYWQDAITGNIDASMTVLVYPKYVKSCGWATNILNSTQTSASNTSGNTTIPQCKDGMTLNELGCYFDVDGKNLNGQELKATENLSWTFNFENYVPFNNAELKGLILGINWEIFSRDELKIETTRLGIYSTRLNSTYIDLDNPEPQTIYIIRSEVGNDLKFKTGTTNILSINFVPTNGRIGKLFVVPYAEYFQKPVEQAAGTNTASGAVAADPTGVGTVTNKCVGFTKWWNKDINLMYECSGKDNTLHFCYTTMGEIITYNSPTIDVVDNKVIFTTTDSRFSKNQKEKFDEYIEDFKLCNWKTNILEQAKTNPCVKLNDSTDKYNCGDPFSNGTFLFNEGNGLYTCGLDIYLYEGDSENIKKCTLKEEFKSSEPNKATDDSSATPNNKNQNGQPKSGTSTPNEQNNRTNMTPEQKTSWTNFFQKLYDGIFGKNNSQINNANACQEFSITLTGDTTWKYKCLDETATKAQSCTIATNTPNPEFNISDVKDATTKTELEAICKKKV